VISTHGIERDKQASALQPRNEDHAIAGGIEGREIMVGVEVV
jgi:hypothetical protein